MREYPITSVRLNPLASIRLRRLKDNDYTWSITVGADTTKKDLDNCVKLLAEYDKKMEKKFRKLELPEE